MIKQKLTRFGATAWRIATGNYWGAVASLTAINTLLLGATSAVAGISMTAFASGASEVVIINVFALTLLIWPTMSALVKGLHDQRKWCCVGAILHALAVFAVMEAYFGKPFGLASGSTFANMAPTAMFLALAAWLMVEWRASHFTVAND